MNTSRSQQLLPSDSTILTTLRALLPERPITIQEALCLAELQAEKLLRIRDINDLPVPTELITDSTRVYIEIDDDLPRHGGSGSSHWDAHRRAWVIAVNAEEPETRQRFTVMHEYKHILDHYHPGLGGRLPKLIYGLEPSEYVAEYFAGCLLMPKRFLKAAYGDGIQQLSDLAELFDVSLRAMEVRLHQIGLDVDEPNSSPARHYRRSRPSPIRRPGWQYRPLSSRWPSRPSALTA